MNIVVVCSLVSLVALVWIAWRAQRNAPALASITPSVTLSAAVPASVATPTSQAPASPAASLAGGLLGQDSKTNRDAIINTNASLRTDPDRLVAGKTYRIPAADVAPVVVETQPAKIPAPVSAAPSHPDAVRSEDAAASVLKYTAVPGDTVGKMAAAFLGSDDKAHQQAIISANPSLQTNADHVEVGRAYKIPVPEGLSATVGTSPVVQIIRPAPQTDADQIVAADDSRTLKYTAVEGDTLGKMATELLGSDTAENRDLILSKNANLRNNSDRVIAGQTYWIPAPQAADVR
jgi:hypothetical protein